MPTQKQNLTELSTAQLNTLTGVGHRTITKRLTRAGIEPIRKDGKTNFWSPPKALPIIFSLQGNPHEEKARLDRVRADKVELELAIARREVAPIPVLEWALSSIAEQINSILDSLPLRIKKRVPKLNAREIENIRREIVKAQNAASEATLDFSGSEEAIT